MRGIPKKKSFTIIVKKKSRGLGSKLGNRTVYAEHLAFNPGSSMRKHDLKAHKPLPDTYLRLYPVSSVNGSLKFCVHAIDLHSRIIYLGLPHTSTIYSAPEQESRFCMFELHSVWMLCLIIPPTAAYVLLN